jgi:hypothetical protein
MPCWRCQGLRQCQATSRRSVVRSPTTAVATAYRRQHDDSDLMTLMHRGEHINRVQLQVHNLIRELLIEAAEADDIRDDIAPDELASYCLHALTAASGLPSKAAARRLVTVTLAGLRRP